MSRSQQAVRSVSDSGAGGEEELKLSVTSSAALCLLPMSPNSSLCLNLSSVFMEQRVIEGIKKPSKAGVSGSTIQTLERAGS